MSQVEQVADRSRPNSVLRRITGVANESALVSLNQIFFSVGGISITSAIARSASSRIAAAVLAVYALESVAVAVARAYFVQAPLLRHEFPKLCRGDVAAANWGMAKFATAWLAVALVAGACYRLPPKWVALIALWTVVALVADNSRSIAVVFGRQVFAVMSAATYAGAMLLLAAFAVPLGPSYFLIAASLLLLALTSVTRRVLATNSQPGNCEFWRRESDFARNLAIEAVGVTAVGSLAAMLIAGIAPSVMVGIQVASQAAVYPALLVTNGLSVPLARRAAARQRAGLSDIPPLAVWAGVQVALILLTLLACLVADPLLAKVFGRGWDAARPLFPVLALQQGLLNTARVVLVRYRARIAARTVRTTFLIGLTVSQAFIVGGALVGGSVEITVGYLAASAWIVVYWVAVLVHWERAPRAITTANTPQQSSGGAS
ncbi:hypothetical protein [Nocardioides sp. KR10-350]|uniref:hypothetical protein n=1 Tax=Nocardioides cheoyonin TaxID=3156615 RepID=UPI0032B52DFB